MLFAETFSNASHWNKKSIQISEKFDFNDQIVMNELR